MSAEALTPLDIEAKLRQLVNDLTRAQAALRQARDLEVDARHEYERARRRALLSDKSPKVTRGGYTVAEQSAWVDEQCADLKVRRRQGDSGPGGGSGPAANPARAGGDRPVARRERPAGIRTGRNLRLTDDRRTRCRRHWEPLEC